MIVLGTDRLSVYVGEEVVISIIYVHYAAVAKIGRCTGIPCYVCYDSSRMFGIKSLLILCFIGFSHTSKYVTIDTDVFYIMIIICTDNRCPIFFNIFMNKVVFPFHKRRCAAELRAGENGKQRRNKG